MSPTQRSGLTALTVAALLASTSAAHAALTTPNCLAKKLVAWGNLRKCQAGENGKALQGKSADPAKCQTKFAATLTKLDAQATKAAIACRYGVNGDGTVIDYDTGLQWEQKDALDGTPNPADAHDADNVYSWSVSAGPPDGTVFTSFLASVNDCPSSDGTTLTGGFAGHCDWRLPTIMELAGIADRGASGCGAGSPCIDPAFGPTIVAASLYWSATTDSDTRLFPDPDHAWVVNFFFGNVQTAAKGYDTYVRAVRADL